MKHIFINLKRFDVPSEFGGVNTLASPDKWAQSVINGISSCLEKYTDVKFTVFFPEAHLIQAVTARKNLPFSIGCQGIFWDDIAKGGNFGAMTTLRPAAAMKALGCDAAIIGHCEERRYYTGILAEAGIKGIHGAEAVNRILGKEINAALSGNLDVLYCIGEQEEEQEQWQKVIDEQIKAINSAKKTANYDKLALAYEPVWAIGPGKTPPDKSYIVKIIQFIKDKTRGYFGYNIPIVYGGGLKEENAEMLASIPLIDGGLVALTRFSGEIGFYPDEFIQIAGRYLANSTKDKESIKGD